MRIKIDLIGERFGLLVVESFVSKDKYGNEKYLCKCDCGNIVNRSRRSLLYNGTKSCGCVLGLHGMTGTPDNIQKTIGDMK